MDKVINFLGSDIWSMAHDFMRTPHINAQIGLAVVFTVICVTCFIIGRDALEAGAINWDKEVHKDG